MKKLLASFLALFIFLFSFATLSPVKAQSTWYNQSFPEWYLKVYDTNSSPPNEIFGERYTAAQVEWIRWSLVAQTLNVAVLGHTEVITCILNGPLTCISDVIQSGVKDVTDMFSLSANGPGSYLSIISSNPVSGVTYIKNLANRFHIVSPAYAQGTGFNASRSVMELWKVTRNISYMFLVIAIVIIAFMIMFRVKISPQVIISVQSALPKLIIALILITFSYAIAGLLIDLMYVVIGLFAMLISQSGMTTDNAQSLFLEFTSKHSAISLLFEYWFMFVVVSFSTIFSSINPMTWIGGLLLWVFALVTILIMLWYSVKMIIIMFKNFVMIMLAIITAPLEIMLGTIVGFSGFGTWFKKFISYLAVYPVWAIMFFLAFFFLGQAVPQWWPNLGNWLNIYPFNIKLDFITANAWDPPLSTWIVTGQSLIWAIVSFIIITITPKVTEVIQSAIQNKPFAYGGGVGEVSNAGRFVGATAETVSRSGALAGASKTTTAIVNALKWLAFIPK